MSRGVYVALSGAVAQEQALEATAANVANASSTGYQRLRPIFRSVLANAQQPDLDLQYARTSRTALDVSPGATRVTENPLDVALPQGVYLALVTPRGERYTRAASMRVSSTGELVTAGGSPVSSDKDEPLKASPTGGSVHVLPDGSVRQGNAVVGKLKLVTFPSPDALSPEGSGVLGAANAGAPSAAPATTQLVVGAVEESNAQPVIAMTEMMQATRTFEAFQKVLDQFGEIDRKLLTTVPTAVE